MQSFNALGTPVRNEGWSNVKVMRLLEQETGVPLLIRKTRGIALTEPGERLLARAGVVSRQVSLACEDLRQSQGEDFGSVRVGVTPFLTFTAQGPAFNWFRQRCRIVDLQLIEGLMTRVIPCLRDGTLDIAVVATDLGELQDDEFTRQRILQAPQCIVVREGHPGPPETRGIVAIESTPLRPCDIELLLPTQADRLLTAAAEYFSHCLMTNSQSA